METDKTKAVSSIVAFYKFKEFIADLAIRYSIKKNETPVDNIDYVLEAENLGVFAKTDLGRRFLVFLNQMCQPPKVDTEIK